MQYIDLHLIKTIQDDRIREATEARRAAEFTAERSWRWVRPAWLTSLRSAGSRGKRANQGRLSGSRGVTNPLE